MASWASDSDSDPYGYDLTVSDEEQLIAVIDSISPPRTAPSSTPRPVPTGNKSKKPTRPQPQRVPSPAESTDSLENYTKDAIAVHEAIEQINEDDLDFDPAELDSDEAAYSHGSGSEAGFAPPALERRPAPFTKWLAPSVAPEEQPSGLSSFVKKTRSRHAPRMLIEPPVEYPDCEGNAPKPSCLRI